MGNISLSEVLGLKIGDKIKILGMNENFEEWDDVLILTKKPNLVVDYIIIHFEYPSGKQSETEVPLELIDDISICF